MNSNDIPKDTLWYNQRILECLENLFLLKGYVVDRVNQNNQLSIVVQNEQQRQSVSLFHLSRQIQCIDISQSQQDQEQQGYKAIQLFVEEICQIFEQENTKSQFQTADVTGIPLFPMIRRNADKKESMWYKAFLEQLNHKVQYPQHEQLVWNLAEHRNNHFRFWTVFDFSKQNVSVEKVWNTAIENLISKTNPPEDWGDGWFCFHQNDGFDAARLAILGKFVQEPVVFAIPSRDLLAFAPLRHHSEMQKWSDEYFCSYPYPLSNAIGIFTPFEIKC